MKTNPTAPINYATALPDKRWDRIRRDWPAYWQLTAASGRTVIVVTTYDELAHWMNTLFPGEKMGGSALRLRSAIGTPPRLAR